MIFINLKNYFTKKIQMNLIKKSLKLFKKDINNEEFTFINFKFC